MIQSPMLSLSWAYLILLLWHLICFDELQYEVAHIVCLSEV